MYVSLLSEINSIIIIIITISRLIVWSQLEWTIAIYLYVLQYC